MIDRGGTLKSFLIEWSTVYAASTIRPLWGHLSRALRRYSCLNGVLDARWCLYRCLSKPLYVVHFLSILYRKKRKVGTVRDDALVMTKILYSRGNK